MKNTSGGAFAGSVGMSVGPGGAVGTSGASGSTAGAKSDTSGAVDRSAKSDAPKHNSLSKKGPGLLLISVGSMLTSMVVAGFLLGYGLDVVLDTQPIFFLSLGLLGFIGGIMKVYKILTAPELH